MRRIMIALTAALAIVGLSACFQFQEANSTYEVRLSFFPPEEFEPFCYGVDLTATFGENTLLDIHIDQTDHDAKTSAQARRFDKQPAYEGMPLIVDVVCRNPSGGEIGHSLYEGKLSIPYRDAHFTLINYPGPQVEFGACIPPTTATGVQMCAWGYGFEFK